MTNERFTALLAGFVQQTLTNEEITEFLEEASKPIHQEVLEQVLDRDFRAGVHSGIAGDEQAAAAFRTLADTIGIARGTEQEPMNTGARPKRISLPFQWAAAAAVVLIIAGGAWLLYGKREQGGEGATKGLRLPKNDLLPGSNKAILTLTDGSKIELDTTRAGLLAQQGAMRVVKAENGVLNYQAMEGPGHGKTEMTYNTLTTPRGGQYQLSLPDGSKIWLNAASSIRYPTAFTGSERKVEITGEVYFEVAGDAMRPFRVTNKGMIVEVLGTHFNINAYEDEPEVRTTLSEGKVRVRHGGNSQLLSPGEQAVLHPSGEIGLEKEIDLEKTMAWKNNQFIFERDELPAILRQLSRWYDVETEYQGPLKPYHFSGVISRARNASEVLQVLQATGNIHFIIEGKKILVTP